MLDIEDFTTPLSTKTREAFNVMLRSRKPHKQIQDEEINTLAEYKSDLPWSKQIWMRTWGCSHNNSDSEYMAGLLAEAGFKLTTDKESADLWLLNSCTVKTPSEIQLENIINDGKQRGKFLVVAGCVSQASPNMHWLKDVSCIGVQQISQTVKVVEETCKGSVVRLFSSKKNDESFQNQLFLPKIRKNKFIEILPINNGCLNNCTYCKTKQARGDLRSFSLNILVEQAKNAFSDGVKELWLTSEDLGAWGRDIGLNILDLLNELLKVIPVDCKMRLGMTNPPYILDYLEEIAEVLENPKVYKFLHIPVQSGSNAVLYDMKREYTKEHFDQIVDYMKTRIPSIYIATDFICAFPTEGIDDFEESLDLIRKYKFPSVFINQFYPRPGTPAARLKKIPTKEARRRTAEMTQLFKSYSRYTEDRIGEQWDVLICEMATDGKNCVGHNEMYEHILVPTSTPQSLLGKTVRVVITGVSKFYMTSLIVKNNHRNSMVCTFVFVLIILYILFKFLLNCL